MKRFIRCICTMMAAVMLLTIPVHATENTSERSSSFFLRCSVYLDELATYTFRACFNVTGTDIMDELGASEIKIQRSLDGENWSTVKTFTMEEYPDLVDEDQATHAAYVTYTGSIGYYYRAKVVLYARNSTGFGEWVQYTSKIKIGG